MPIHLRRQALNLDTGDKVAAAVVVP